MVTPLANSIAPPREISQEKASSYRARPADGATSAPAEDSADFSPQAQEAAAIARLAENIKDSEIRQQKVEEAKRRIEEGTYKLASIVNVVAERIAGMVTA